VVPCKNKLILKNFRPEPPPSVDRSKIILFQHGTTSEMKQNNFSMNIHETVLQPVTAFMYCNRHAAAGRRWQTKVGNFRVPLDACATNSTHGWGFAKIIL